MDTLMGILAVVRRCFNCVQQATCGKWLDDAGDKRRYEYFCPNAEFIEQLKSKADRKSTRLNSSHIQKSRMPSSA